MDNSELAAAIKNGLDKISEFPDWMQAILLEDIRSTIETRVGLMEKILQGRAQIEG